MVLTSTNPCEACPEWKHSNKKGMFPQEEDSRAKATTFRGTRPLSPKATFVTLCLPGRATDCGPLPVHHLMNQSYCDYNILAVSCQARGSAQA